MRKGWRTVGLRKMQKGAERPEGSIGRLDQIVSFFGSRVDLCSSQVVVQARLNAKTSIVSSPHYLLQWSRSPEWHCWVGFKATGLSIGDWRTVCSACSAQNS